MRFLLDNSVSWRVGRDLRGAGHDAEHVASIGLDEADDMRVFRRAVEEGRVLMTQDSDFGPIYSASESRTGVLLLRLNSGNPAAQAAIILDNMETLERCLGARGYAILTDSGIVIADVGEASS